MAFYTDRKKAEGHGSAKTGTEHFIQQRLSAVALIPITILFFTCVAPLIGSNIEDVREAFKDNYWLSLIASLMTILTGIHIIQGMQVVIEDYVSHQGARIFGLFKLKIGVALLVIATLWSIATLTFS